MVVVATQPLPIVRDMAETHGAPETEQHPKVWTRGNREIKSCQKTSGEKSPLLDSTE